MLNAQRVTLYLVDPVRQELWVAVSKDLPVGAQEGVRIPVGKGIAGHVAATADTINIADAYQDPRFNQEIDNDSGFRTQSMLTMPIAVGDSRPIAVIQCINRNSGPTGHVSAFDDQDEAALRGFCMEVALALKRHTVEAALLKVMQDTSSTKEQEFNVSLMALYSDQATVNRLHTTVLVRSVSHAQVLSWPSGASLRSGDQSVERLMQWSFNCFDYSHDELALFTEQMLLELDVPVRHGIPLDNLRRLIVGVRAKYRNNPYHNWYHGFSVMHAAFLILATTPAGNFLPYIETFATLIAALCHDIDHPGHGNGYEMDSKSALALCHSDDAVLERHHSHETFRLCLRDDVKLFDGLTPVEYQRVRRCMIHAILATDMSKHSAMVEHLTQRGSAAAAGSST